MKEERIKKLILEVLIGIAILCVGIFIPASEIIRVLMIVIGAITVAINGVALISNIHGDVKEITSNIVCMLLGIALIVWPVRALTIVIAVYLIAIPLIKIFCMHMIATDYDYLKIILGILFLVFSFDIVDSIMRILLIIIGAFTILFAIYKFVTYKRASDFFHKLFKSEENTIENKKSDHIDFDFSDKDDKK